MSQQVYELDYDFGDLMDEAEDEAKGSWEENFVSDIRDKFDSYGDRMYLSEKQEEILKRIAKW